MPDGSSILMQAPCAPAGSPVATATICAGAGTGQSIKLRRVVSLFGTKRGCKFVLRDNSILRRHCVIVNTGYRYILRDLITEGQTFRNGLKVEQEFLDSGDRIKIGPWEFKLEVVEPRFAGGQDSPVIVDLEPDPSILAVEDIDTRHIGKLGREVSIIGRSPHADFSVADREVSRVHAIVFMYLSRPAIFDLASENGTLVNGERAVFARLQDGDELQIGSRKLRFRSNAPSQVSTVGSNGKAVLRPTPFASPEGTLSDLIDLSAETRMR